MAEKILIVDDDLETLRLVGLMLQRQGYQIVSAHNGTEGINLAISEQPHLIVLDVMMPDMDGYQAARLLRTTPETASIPILMFTAKSQVDDKVAGYDSGVDDYLTKPVHPAELIAHIKALLTRTHARAAAPALKRGFVLGVMGTKGGVGATTLAFNLGLAIYQKTKADLVCAEIRPGQGSLAYELGFTKATGLGNLLRMKPGEITRSTVENELLRSNFGIRLLMSTYHLKDTELAANGAQIEAIFQHLSTLCQFLILDLGTAISPALEKAVNICDEIIIISEPHPLTARLTNQLMDELYQFGFGKSKLLNLVVVNRVRADLQLSAVQIQELLGKQINLVIPPVPELSYHAAMRSTPLIQIQPEGVYAQQIIRLANQYLDRIKQ